MYKENQWSGMSSESWKRWKWKKKEKKWNTSLRFQRDQSTLLVCHDVFDIEKEYLVGISVSGPDYCGFEQIPALFTSVLKHYKWINETISKHFDEWMY